MNEVDDEHVEDSEGHSPFEDSRPSEGRESPPGDTLEKALSRHGLSLDPSRHGDVEKYCHLLWDWNEKINLTRHVDFERFVTRDLVDTQKLAELILPNEEVIDLGSGGGVPGLLLAVLRPDLKVTLTDSIAKKARALEDMVKRLGKDVRVVSGRAEEVLEEERFDATTTRGVGALWKILSWLKPHWLGVGRLLTIKGPKWTEERGEARHRGLLNDLSIRVASEYETPGSGAHNFILKIWPATVAEK